MNRRELFLYAGFLALAGCGGGGGDTPAAPTPATPAPPTQAQIDAQKAETAATLRTYMLQQEAAQAEAMVVPLRDLKFRLFSQGLDGSSVAAEQTLALVMQFVRQLAEACAQQALALSAAGRLYDPAAIGAEFNQQRDRQITAHAGGVATSTTGQSITTEYARVTGTLRSAGLVS